MNQPYICIWVCVLSHVWLFVMLWTLASQFPLSLGFSRQEYWSGLPFPLPTYTYTPSLTDFLPICNRSTSSRVLCAVHYVPNSCLFYNFPGAQAVKNLPAMQETWVWYLDWTDPLEKGMATHSSILAWRISWTEGPGRLQFMGSQRSWTQLSD